MKMVIKRFVICNLAALLVLGWAVTAGAQDGDIIDCDPAIVLSIFPYYENALKEPEANVADIARQMQADLGRVQGSCAELLWQATGDYVSDVIMFPDGFFRLMFYSGESIMSIASIVRVDGECGDVTSVASAADPVGQTLVELRGCVGIITVQTTGNWGVTLEPIAP